MRRRRALAASGAKIAMATTAAARRRRIPSGDGKSSFRRIGFLGLGRARGARNGGGTHSAIVCVGLCCLGGGPKKLSSRVYLSSFLARERRAPLPADGRLLRRPHHSFIGLRWYRPRLGKTLSHRPRKFQHSRIASIPSKNVLWDSFARSWENARPDVDPPAASRDAPSLLTRPAADRRPPRGASRVPR